MKHHKYYAIFYTKNNLYVETEGFFSKKEVDYALKELKEHEPFAYCVVYKFQKEQK